jgi:hypothetical protein
VEIVAVILYIGGWLGAGAGLDMVSKKNFAALSWMVYIKLNIPGFIFL